MNGTFLKFIQMVSDKIKFQTEALVLKISSCNPIHVPLTFSNSNECNCQVQRIFLNV